MVSNDYCVSPVTMTFDTDGNQFAGVIINVFRIMRFGDFRELFHVVCTRSKWQHRDEITETTLLEA